MLVVLVYAPASIVLAVALAAVYSGQRRPLLRAGLWSAAICAALTFLAVALHFGFAEWLMARIFIFALIAAIAAAFDRSSQIHRRGYVILGIAQRRASGAVMVGAAIAAAMCIWPLIAQTRSGAVFGDPAELLQFAALGSGLAARAAIVLVWFDALASGVLTYVVLRRRQLSVAASLFGATAWLLAGGRLAPQASGFQPTLLLPAALLAWEIIGRRGAFVAAGMALAISFIAPQLFVPTIILIAADCYARGMPSRRTLGALATAFAVGFGFLLVRIALFVPPGFIVGPTADAMLRLTGGDGAYPWEWLYPGPIGATFGDLAYSVQSLLGHFGNTWQRSVSAGWAVLLLAAAGMFHVLRYRPDLRRFMVCGLLLSMYAALPSHVGGIPIPDLALVAPAWNFWLSTGAYAGVTGIFLLCVVAASEIDFLLQARTVTGTALVYASIVLLMICAPLIPGLVWNPNSSSLANQLGGARSVCRGQIGLAPGYSKDDPVNRENRAAVLFALGSLAKVQSEIRSVELSDVNRRSTLRCFVVDYDEVGQYLAGPTAAAVVLPLSLSSLNVAAKRSPESYMLPGFTIVSLDGGIFVYRRSR
jgi:hypothetical protein